MAKGISVPEYRAFLSEMRDRIDAARNHAARAVNHELVLLYWDIGKGIVQKQRKLGWGDGVVERLSRDLNKYYPGTFGFSSRNLWDMRRFFEAWASPPILRQAVAELEKPSRKEIITGRKESEKPAMARVPKPIEILRQAVAEIPWSHHLLLLNKLEDLHERIWYMRACAHFGWSRNVLLNQILADAYGRSHNRTNNFATALPAAFAQQAQEAIKSSYNLDFLGVAKVMDERELEERLVERVRDFILELGYGFCFVGQQHKLTLGRKDYRVDLLCYHRFLRTLVAIDLKVNEFEPEHAGQMDFYLNVLDAKERAPDDNASIGIILCAEKDEMVVEFSLHRKQNAIGVASYQLLYDLPKELRGKLPSANELKDVLARALASENPGKASSSKTKQR
ncbi:MAG: PDDEXK nuclease domain-containing protein [Flavobacteriales bacterium]